MKTTESGWLDVITEHLSGYPDWLIEFGTYGIGACFLGFVLKNFGRFMLSLTITILLLLWFFSHLDIVTIHLENLKDVLGLQAIQTIDDGVRVYAQWAQEHWAACIGSIVGFIIGWKWSP